MGILIMGKGSMPAIKRPRKAMKAKIESVPTQVKPGELVRRIGYLPHPARPEVQMMSKDFPQNVSELVGRLQETGALS